MREIKFRAWDTRKEKMISSDELMADYRYFDLMVFAANGYRTRVMQYTGLKDKNGKEIYEGDIVAFEDSDGGYEYQDIVINTGIVEYGELRFYFTNRVAVEMDDFYIKDGRCDDIEVLGNIYENPELIVKVNS